MALDRPKLIFEAQVKRKQYSRRFAWNLIAALAAVGAWGAFTYIKQAGTFDVDPVAVEVGLVAALGVAGVFAVRGIFNLLRRQRRENEAMRFFDKGFVWQRGKQRYKYGWSQVKNFREGIRQVRLGRFVIAERGAHMLTMRDGQQFKFTSIQGDPRKFAKAVRPYIADAIGQRMARTLREGRDFKLHPQLIVTAEGVQTAKAFVPWSSLDVTVKRGQLTIRRTTSKGQFQTIQSYPNHEVDNLGGFVELVNSTIRSYQPDRFNIQVFKPDYEY